MNTLLIITNFALLAMAVFFKIKCEKKAAQLEAKLDSCNKIETDYKDLLQQYIEKNAKVAELSAKLEQEIETHKGVVSLFASLENDLVNKFKAISSDVVSKGSKDLLDIANSTLDNREKAISIMLEPIKQVLGKFDNKINEIENSRVGSYESLSQQIKTLSETQKELRSETVNLSRALRSPNTIGQWGEVQLERLLEISGMLHHVDFVQQCSVISMEDGHIVKPDVLINLPEDKKIIIDVKTPFVDYAKAVNEHNEELKGNHVKDFVKRVKSHIADLEKKKYWEHIAGAPNFVIMFMPIESMFSMLLQCEPEIIETAMSKNIVIATPSTLLAMLHVLAIGWRQANISKNIHEIVTIGKSVCDKINLIEEILQKVGKGIHDSSAAHRDAMNLLERGVFAESKRFAEIAKET